MNSYSASYLKCAASWTKAEEKLNVYRQQRDSVDLNLEAKAVLEQIVNVDNQLNELTFREAEISQLYKKITQLIVRCWKNARRWSKNANA